MGGRASVAAGCFCSLAPGELSCANESRAELVGGAWKPTILSVYPVRITTRVSATAPVSRSSDFFLHAAQCVANGDNPLRGESLVVRPAFLFDEQATDSSADFRRSNGSNEAVPAALFAG